jgi:hypothetical protein
MNVGLGKNARDVADHIAPAAWLGHKPVKFRRVRQPVPLRNSTGKRRSPITVIGSDRQTDPGAMPAERRLKPRQPPVEVRVELRLAQVIAGCPDHVCLRHDQLLHALAARPFSFNPDQTAGAGGATGGDRCRVLGAASQAGKQPCAGPFGQPQRDAGPVQGFGIAPKKGLQRPGGAAMRPKMQNNVHDPAHHGFNHTQRRSAKIDWGDHGQHFLTIGLNLKLFDCTSTRA